MLPKLSAEEQLRSIQQFLDGAGSGRPEMSIEARHQKMLEDKKRLRQGEIRRHQRAVFDVHRQSMACC